MAILQGDKCISPVTMYDRDDSQMRARRLRLFQRATVCPCFLSLRIPNYLSNKLFIQILLTCSGAGLGILPLSPLRQAETAGRFSVVIYMMRTGRSVIHTSGLIFKLNRALILRQRLYQRLPSAKDAAATRKLEHLR